MTTMKPSVVSSPASVDAKAQEFAHRVIEFADYEACIKFFESKPIDFDRPNDGGWTVLMSVVASARVDLIGYVMDHTNNVESGTIPNGATVLHMAATSSIPQVVQELAGTDARVVKLRAIANACNVNGDTPLMMACVAKNAAAVQILLEKIQAFPSPCNSSGMTALMCASRLQDDKDAAESDAIVALLLAHGVDVNAVTLTGRQTALHVALDSCNVSVIQQLIEHKDIDFNIRNKAGNTPLRLARRLKLDSLINAAVEKRWEQVDNVAKEMSDLVAQELADAVAVPQKQQNSKSKKKKKSATKTSTSVPKSVQVEEDNADKKESAPPSIIEAVITESDNEVAKANVPPESVAAIGESDEWITATAKKSKRKEAASADKPRQKPKSKMNTKSNETHKPNQPKKPPTQPTHSAPTATSPPRPPKAVTPAWAVPSTLPEPTGRPSTPLSTASSSTNYSYDQLNAIFHRTFPIAQEMDVNVESFLAGSASHDAVEVLHGLSVSQVEMLQEAHLQAYQFLNERKLELVRDLEAQRLEAQMELRRKILELP